MGRMDDKPDTPLQDMRDDQLVWELVKMAERLTPRVTAVSDEIQRRLRAAALLDRLRANDPWCEDGDESDADLAGGIRLSKWIDARISRK